MKRWLTILATLIWVGAATAQVPDDLTTEAGDKLLKDYIRDGVTIGQYWQYLPAPAAAYTIPRPIGSDPMPIVVLVHGSIRSVDEALDTALRYLDSYDSDADSQRFAIVAPVFKSTDFNGPLGGYRGMVGRHRPCLDPRHSDADNFVNGILDAYIHKHPELFAKRALFFGHSAGGQFLSRYIVTHPHRVAAAVLSAPGTFAFPDPAVIWTDGMRERSGNLRWDNSPQARPYLFRPEHWKFRITARLPVTVMVGDSESCHCIPISEATPGADTDGSHCDVDNQTCTTAWTATGEGTRYRRGELWVEAMRDYAGLPDPADPDFDPADPGVLFDVAAGVGHSSAQTQPLALPILMNHRPQTSTVDWLMPALAPIQMSTLY